MRANCTASPPTPPNASSTTLHAGGDAGCDRLRCDRRPASAIHSNALLVAGQGCIGGPNTCLRAASPSCSSLRCAACLLCRHCSLARSTPFIRHHSAPAGLPFSRAYSSSARAPRLYVAHLSGLPWPPGRHLASPYCPHALRPHVLPLHMVCFHLSLPISPRRHLRSAFAGESAPARPPCGRPRRPPSPLKVKTPLGWTTMFRWWGCSYRFARTFITDDKPSWQMADDRERGSRREGF